MEVYRKIHIWDLPTNKIYIKFKEEFSQKFFDLVHSKFGNFNSAGRFLGIKRPDTILAKNWRLGETSYPLNLMLKLADETNISLEELEEHIKEIRYKTSINKRGGNSGKPITNPKLPILVNEDFAEILGHICGDGTISRSNPNKGIPLKYVNSEPALMLGFQKLILDVFGDIQPNVIVREGYPYRTKNYVLDYPSIISLFILHVFDYRTDVDMKLPSFIFSMSSNAKARFLRAMFDDEACVSENRKKILFGLKPLEPVEDIIKLLNEFGIKTSGIYKCVGKTYQKFEISGQNSIQLFNKIIGFKHPMKNKKLEKIISNGWKFNRYQNNEAGREILNLISKNNGLEVIQISKILKRDIGTIKEHLEKLKREEKVISYKIQKRTNNTNAFPNIWSLKHNGQQKQRIEC